MKTEYEFTKRAKKRKETYHLNKEKVFNLLGDKCTRCGFEDKRALQLDHINGDGPTDRKVINTWRRLEKILTDTTYRLSFQLLCANCNWIKRAENGEVRKHWPRNYHITKPMALCEV